MKSAVRGADIISSHIYELADEARTKMKEILKEPFENGAMCINPDLWSDSYKQVSYLGLTTTIVDQSFKYHSIELSCKQYVEMDHSSGHMLTVSVKTTCLVIDVLISANFPISFSNLGDSKGFRSI